MFIWYIFSGFGFMHQDESGNPGIKSNKDGSTKQRRLVIFASKKVSSLKNISKGSFRLMIHICFGPGDMVYICSGIVSA
jgi:hypothetical protein